MLQATKPYNEIAVNWPIGSLIKKIKVEPSNPCPPAKRFNHWRKIRSVLTSLTLKCQQLTIIDDHDIMKNYPNTPDGRYFIVRGRLWRCSNPSLSENARDRLVKELMSARRAIRDAKKDDSEAIAQARKRVNDAKVGLGERGPVWWKDGTPDLNRHMVKNTPYAHWFAQKSDPEKTRKRRGDIGTNSQKDKPEKVKD